ncbi:putative C2H2 transcription factor [Aspergillus nomiae NRRL 13137]|uniref:Putative C2H2 transcription factor n=1 Tax=Aspergillus nomiae NRRL (strain ATCC 15546 / NRRL 13137 / CBS 260.88 / M93) TaxID=1509407 RepID=A0A0L1IWD7_ASPN3|nr:putative C2H2 transcription factor [Aspergillus nomiae NRRL 13137]KNG83876.1 putative C2H2 transcription factor [Aspergillus nomiae NRRL 13137]
MDPSTGFDLPAGDYPAIDIQAGLGISILPSKRQPYTPEPCACPPYPPQPHLYTPPTLQHYALPDMTDMADLIPYTMERVHLREPPELENNMFYTPFRARGTSPPPHPPRPPHPPPPRYTTRHATPSTTTLCTQTTTKEAPQNTYTHHLPYHPPTTPPDTTTSSNTPTYPPPHPSPTSATAAVVSASAGPPPPAATQKDLTHYGIQTADQTWRCAYPGCTSQTLFRRGCDLRKHFNRHRKHLFCRHRGCPQAVAGGFSSKKDRDRHEAKHNPVVCCEWAGCERVFSRVDNMKDHVRRIHRRRE